MCNDVIVVVITDSSAQRALINMASSESVVDQDDDIAAEDDVGFPLKFPPDVEEAIAEVKPAEKREKALRIERLGSSEQRSTRQPRFQSNRLHQPIISNRTSESERKRNVLLRYSSTVSVEYRRQNRANATRHKATGRSNSRSSKRTNERRSRRSTGEKERQRKFEKNMCVFAQSPLKKPRGPYENCFFELKISRLKRIVQSRW